MLNKKNTVFISCIKYYLLVSIIFFLVAFFAIFSNTKVGLHSWINQFHNPGADVFFYFATFLGDGAFVFLVILTSWFFDKKFAVQLLIAFVVSFLLVWTGKFFIFPGIQRPIAVFEQNKLPLYLAKNSSMSRFYSFPSGHAATAFMLFTALSFKTKKNWLQLLYVILAIIVSYSRVYFSQHFLSDVLAGALLGTICSIVVFFLTINLNVSRLPDNPENCETT